MWQGVARSYSNLTFNFLGTAKPFSKVAAPFLHSHQQRVRFQFLHILTTLTVVFLVPALLVGARAISLWF